jgi:MFS family permease
MTTAGNKGFGIGGTQGTRRRSLTFCFRFKDLSVDTPHIVRMPATAGHPHSRLRAAAGRYRQARHSLRTPASPQSRHGLDWMNFFVADVQTGFGTFVAFYLAESGWSQGNIGVALSAAGIAGMISQIPGGAVADAITWKRGLAAAGIVITGVAALLLGLTPNFVTVFVAQILQGATAGIITPAIGAISLGLVGRSAIAVRAGRNYRYAAAGHALTAALMGAAGAYLWNGAIFYAAAALCIPALISLAFICGDEIDYARARNAGRSKEQVTTGRVIDLVKNHKLVLFTAATLLFQLADASVLPVMGENLVAAKYTQAAIWMSGLIIAPQIVVALLAPWVGFHSEKRGRRPLLLIGFGLEPIRIVLLAFTSAYPFLMIGQIMSGITGAVIGVLTILVIADLTAGTGRFNLAVGAVGTVSGIAASVSTSATGFLFQAFGQRIGYLPLAAIAAAATGLIWVFVAETKPQKYED